MPAFEVNCWLHYLSIKPRGDSRLDWNCAMISYMVNNIARMFSKNSPHIPLDKFIIKWHEDNDDEEIERVIRNMINMCQRLGQPVDMKKVQRIREEAKMKAAMRDFE